MYFAQIWVVLASILVVLPLLGSRFIAQAMRNAGELESPIAMPLARLRPVNFSSGEERA